MCIYLKYKMDALQTLIITSTTDISNNTIIITTCEIIDKKVILINTQNIGNKMKRNKVKRIVILNNAKNNG